MKTLFTQDALINAGTERSNFELISRFSSDLEVSVVYFYPHHELKEVYERAGIRLFFLNIPERYHLLKGTWRLIQLIRKEKPDLVVSSLWRADIMSRFACWFTNTPLVGTLVNDSYAPLAWKDKQGWKHRVVYWLDRLTSGIPFHWISNAQALIDSHVKTLGIDRKKITVVYRGRMIPELVWDSKGERGKGNGDKGIDNRDKALEEEKDFRKTASTDKVRIAVTDDVIAPARCGGSEERPKPALPAGRQSQKKGEDRFVPRDDEPIRNFISYGRLLERKGFQDAIQAFAAVLNKYPDCTLTVFGEGPYRQELESLIQKLDLQNSVFLPGKISNPIDVLIHGFHLSEPYCHKQRENENVTSNSKISSDNVQRKTYNLQPKKAHCFLFPSWYEGFSGALVEAMMAGIPIIASDIPMNLEAVESNKSALIFPVCDNKALEDKMIFAIETPEFMYQLGQEARNQAVKRFDIEKIAKQYEETLLSLAKK
ncbi:glycosyltransferase [Algoriphagus kandeliae]|uniref:Glycosyltransferase n=1 Tax=Algoriphagus kandeliae TaxID=2562278 RepID=A0A4Y9QYT7_9BACT|nr:glycosyltransferase family 4 protein [Algoriphagus kandeliae]TFV97267.1 glycosyltransferase [Algoriphagus kandeliae]